MNELERRMVEALSDLRENDHVNGDNAKFEGLIADEDANRLQMLQSRYGHLIEASGGRYE